MSIVDAVSCICLLAGSLFCVVGGIGLLRLPAFFSRLPGAGITDTMGAGLVLVGLAVYNQGHALIDYFGDNGTDDALLPDTLVAATLITVKLIMILVLLWLTSPTSTHAIAKAALLHGLEPRLAEEPGSDERRNSTDG